MLGLSRVEAEDFLGRRHVPLSEINEAELDREAAVFEAGSRRTRYQVHGMIAVSNTTPSGISSPLAKTIS
jgi:hypothetical protein